MEADCIHFKETGYFSKIILDYLSEDKSLAPFYQSSPKISAFKGAIENKKFSLQQRKVLTETLKQQYENGKISLKKTAKVAENIAALNQENTFSVTTGHQLCLFTGPLYFIYKIVSTIKLANELKKAYPEQNFVPIYWMATEDHDFEEINHFYFKGKRIKWITDQKGAVGRMKTDGLAIVFEEFKTLLVDYSTHTEGLKSLFEKSYLLHDNLADATRFLVNELFSAYGVVIIDGDSIALKEQMHGVFEEELKQEVSSHLVEQQSEELSKHYKVQVNPREINLFYLQEGSRKRIVKKDDTYFINETEQQFSEEEILQKLKDNPECFSPNVLLRPLYQEMILPNLAYIGGGGELAYWFQLKSTFDHFKTPLPVLLLRNSAMWMDEKQTKYFKQLDISLKQLFLDEGVLLKEWVKENAKENLELTKEKKEAADFYIKLEKKIQKIDGSLHPHLEALKTKHQKELKSLSEKIIRTERKKQSITTAHINYLKTALFPNRGLQERHDNFSEIYLSEGKTMIELLLKEFELPAEEFLAIHY